MGNNFGLSKTRTKKLAVKALIKRITKIVFTFLLITAVIIMSVIFVNKYLLKSQLNAFQGASKDDATMVSNNVTIMPITVTFNSSIHTDEWKMFLNDELVDTYATQKGVQSIWNIEILLNEDENQKIIIKSARGKEYDYGVESFITKDNAINLEIDGDFHPADVQIQLQNPELPNGCEATSLSMLLCAAGVETTKQQAALAIPSEDFAQDEEGRLTAPNPEKFYAGQPESKNRGFYAFVPPVQQAANDLFENAGSALKAQDLSGTSFEEIYELLKTGYPIMLWITIDYGELKNCKNFSWLFSDSKESYIPIANLHCVVAQQKDNEDITVFDPIKGEINVEYEKLKYIYEQMGSRALYID